MKRKSLILTLIAIILICIAYTLVKQRSIAPIPENHKVATTSFSWRFVTTESEDGLPPRTQVALIANGDVYNAGTYAGSCSEISSENLLEGEVSAVLCWWGGIGDELGVFKEEDRLILKRGTQKESSAGKEGLRGDFVEVTAIK